MADSKKLPKAFNGYKLASIDELKESLEMGMEVTLFMRGVWYLLEEKADGRAAIAQCPDGQEKTYKTWDDLFNSYKVGGQPIGELWREFEIETM